MGLIMASYISHPLLKKNAIESRLYQQVLAGDVLKKGNTMVVAPTALGKSIVAILVAADRLKIPKYWFWLRLNLWLYNMKLVLKSLLLFHVLQ